MILADELGGLLFLILLVWGAWLIPPLACFIIGLRARKNYPNRAKTLYVFAIVCFLIGGGICASILN